MFIGGLGAIRELRSKGGGVFSGNVHRRAFIGGYVHRGSVFIGGGYDHGRGVIWWGMS